MWNRVQPGKVSSSQEWHEWKQTQQSTKLKPIVVRTQGRATQRQLMVKHAQGKKLPNQLHCQIQQLSLTGTHSWGFPHFRLQPQPSTVAAEQLDHLYNERKPAESLKLFIYLFLIKGQCPLDRLWEETSCQLSHQSTITLTFVFIQHLWNFSTLFVVFFFDFQPLVFPHACAMTCRGAASSAKPNASKQ